MKYLNMILTLVVKTWTFWWMIDHLWSTAMHLKLVDVAYFERFIMEGTIFGMQKPLWQEYKGHWWHLLFKLKMNWFVKQILFVCTLVQGKSSFNFGRMIMKTVMLVTSLCWWLICVVSSSLLLADSLCWQLFSLFWWFSQYI